MKSILYLSSIAWDFLKQRPQEITEAFSMLGHNVIYIGNREYLRASRINLKRIKRLFFTEEIKINENLKVINMRILYPEKVFKSFFKKKNLSNKIKEFQQIIKKYFGEQKDKNIIIISNPMYLELFDIELIGKNSIKIYDCVDDMEHFFKEREDIEKFKFLEKKLIKAVDEIWFTGEKLCEIYLEKYKSYISGKKTKIVPNGISKNIFDNIFFEKKFKTSNKINIGFVGAIAEWIDIDLIKEILKNDKYVLNVAGPDFINVLPELRKYKNFNYYGIIEKSMVPTFNYNQDICLLPFKVENSLSISSEPLKLIEYLYLKKPVISTKIPAIKKVEDMVYIVESLDDVEKIIYTALNENENIKDLRHRYANEYIWEKIAYEAIKDL
ncbi:hypothetical protein [Carboxydothermus hydrogenoformans]|uniref:Uncharacterized protein n=1 Tax=Carboxydothermus hydrogenoformans (strain ATCC BAA-161 / DSM 6008 / Z-2901) TaxID=246194 RepID=Q3AD85_CARHZ|nr:hypothetical protein [Carboxydothermus hydrogenoformans]ABB16237.1 conserved hypothetical protein [Carboxydothermus hydrogenoformans Z-2901]